MELESHKSNPVNDAIKIRVADVVGPGGANHHYVLSGFSLNGNPSFMNAGRPNVSSETHVFFQNGPVHDSGVNGVTNEALLAIVEHRLASFQSGKYACDENRTALECVQRALRALHTRTGRRVEQGVEGTMKEDPKPGEPASRGPTGLGDRFKEGKPFEDHQKAKIDALGKSGYGPKSDTGGDKSEPEKNKNDGDQSYEK